MAGKNPPPPPDDTHIQGSREIPPPVEGLSVERTFRNSGQRNRPYDSTDQVHADDTEVVTPKKEDQQ